MWEPPYDENGLDDPDEVYEKYHKQRMFFIYIDDVTNSDQIELDIANFTVTSTDKFIQVIGKSE